MNALVTRRSFLPERSLFRGLEGLHREIDALFDGLFGERDTPAVRWAPRVETFVDNDTLHVRADLPGVDPKAVEVSLEDDVLTVRGERKAEHERPSYREVSYGRFERRIRVPEGTEAEKITARYANGVLEIAVPFPKPVSRKVTVDVRDGASA